MDHAIPVDDGGTTAIDNLRLACAVCNKQKGSMTELEYRARLARQREHERDLDALPERSWNEIYSDTRDWLRTRSKAATADESTEDIMRRPLEA